MKQPLLIACDFDGTVTSQDTLVEILDRYGSPAWRQVQDEVVAGTLSIREGLQSQMHSVRADAQELELLLKERVAVAPSFTPFFETMRRKGIPVILLSGGFDLCVEIVMKGAGLWPLPFLSNRLLRTNESWSVEFPYPSSGCEDCGHCKGDPVRTWRQQGFTTVFVGNGVTDRCGAKAANLTFAKDELFSWCRSQGIDSMGFESFADVEQELARRGWL